MNTGSLISSPNKPAVSFIRLINGINSCIEVDRSMYFLSVVLREIYACIFLPQWIGHPAYIVTKPVCDNTDSREAWSPYFHPPAKSASTYHSRPHEVSVLCIIPLSLVSIRYLQILLTDCSCERCVSLLNIARWWVSIVMSGRVVPFKYTSMPKIPHYFQIFFPGRTIFVFVQKWISRWSIVCSTFCGLWIKTQRLDNSINK